MSQNFRLKNNSLFIVAEAVGGFFNADQLRTVASVSESESAVLKVTEDGAIGFMVEESRVSEIGERFRENGMILKHYRSTQTPLARACLGELCPKHEQDALGHSIEVASTLQNAFPDGSPFLRIGMNGCAQNCLASGTDDIHIVGESTGYKIQIGGKASEIPQLGQFLAENIQAHDLGAYLEHIVTVYIRECQAGESMHDVIERTGLGIFELNNLLEREEDGVGERAPSESASDLLSAEATDLDSDTLLTDSAAALAEEDNLFLDTELDSLDQTDLNIDKDPSSQLIAIDGNDDLQGDLLGETDLLGNSNVEDVTEETQKHDPAEDSVSLDTLDTLDEGELSNSILDPADLDDGLMDLGSMDASVLADLTMNPQTDNEPILAESIEAPDQYDEGSPLGNGTTQDELMDDEISMGTSDATEDDVSRVTQAMRSEAAIEQSIGNSATSASAGESLSDVNDLDIENQIPTQAEQFDLSESDSPDTQGSLDEQALVPDIPESFLELQDAAANGDALQVKLIEDIVSIKTPEGVMLNLPVQSLHAGLRIVLNLGQPPFEAYIRDEKVIIRYGQTSVALPLEAIASRKAPARESIDDEALLDDAA